MGENARKILIVDDERLITKVLARKLDSAGYITEIVSDGKEAMEALSKRVFDVIVLDLVMPHMDGFAVLQQLRLKNNHIPIIVTTNLSQEEDKARAKLLGAQNYFVKANTTLGEIVSKIKSIVG
jgi:CheY-like chemotaxis protein